MSWFERLTRRRDSGIDDEIEAHLRMAVDDRVSRGEPTDEARRRALLEFGSVSLAREDASAVWRWTSLEQLLQDLRSGARILTTAPGVSLTAILLVALVIGGNTSVYSMVHGMLTKPAAGVDPRGMVSIGWTGERGQLPPETSFPMYRELATHTGLDLVAFHEVRFTIGDRDGTYALGGVAVSPNYFDVLRLQFSRGRPFLPSETTLDAHGLVAIISHTAWQVQFASAEDVVGRSIRVNGQPAVIVGIAPPRFQGVWIAEASDVWVPLLPYSRLRGNQRLLTDPTMRSVAMVGRLGNGTSIAAAQAEIRALAARVHEFPGDRDSTTAPVPVVLSYTGNAGRNNVIAVRGPQFLAIFSVVTLLTLLIVSANVANLMLARAVMRQREMAVRMSFGASRLRILRLVLAEGLTVSLAAWGAACLFAYWMSQVLPGLIPPSTNGGARIELDATPDWQVLGYAMLLAVAGAVFFSIGPAARTWRQDLLPFLKAGEQGAAPGRSRLTSGLVVLQLAFSVLLLTNAGLAYRSLDLVQGTDLGFDNRGILLITVDTSPVAKTREVNTDLLTRMVDALRATPGVQHASFATTMPSYSWPEVPIRTPGSDEAIFAERSHVAGGYLSVHGVTVLSGRGFAATDRTGPPTVVVTRHLAESLWPGEAAAGRTILIGDDRRPATVVGVAPNVFFGGFRKEPRPAIVLLPAERDGIQPGVAHFFVKHSVPLDTIVPAAGRALRGVAPDVAMAYVRPMSTDLDEITWSTRTLTMLLTVFAGGSLVIATLGQYAAMAFAVRRRFRDFGVRIALGASRAQVVTAEIRRGLRLTAIGLVAGLGLGLAAGRSASALLYGVSFADRTAAGAVVMLLGAASVVACYLPARRAAGVDPIQALRSE